MEKRDPMLEKGKRKFMHSTRGELSHKMKENLVITKAAIAVEKKRKQRMQEEEYKKKEEQEKKRLEEERKK